MGIWLFLIWRWRWMHIWYQSPWPLSDSGLQMQLARTEDISSDETEIGDKDDDSKGDINGNRFQWVAGRKPVCQWCRTAGIIDVTPGQCTLHNSITMSHTPVAMWRYWWWWQWWKLSWLVFRRIAQGTKLPLVSCLLLLDPVYIQMMVAMVAMVLVVIELLKPMRRMRTCTDTASMTGKDFFHHPPTPTPSWVHHSNGIGSLWQW